MDFYAFFAARNDIEHAVRLYATERVASFVGIMETLDEHLHDAAPAHRGIIERTAFRAADAMRTYEQASAGMSDRDRAFGNLGPVFELWSTADERMIELHAIIAAAYGYEGDEEEI